MNDSSSLKCGSSSLEAVLLSIPEGYQCVDLSLYKVHHSHTYLGGDPQSLSFLFSGDVINSFFLTYV